MLVLSPLFRNIGNDILAVSCFIAGCLTERRNSVQRTVPTCHRYNVLKPYRKPYGNPCKPLKNNARNREYR